MTNQQSQGFRDPSAAVARLTPIDQAERARIEAAEKARIEASQSTSCSNPFNLSIGRSAINTNMKPKARSSISTNLGKTAWIEPLTKDNLPTPTHWRQHWIFLDQMA
jgi:hypothetical protein